MLTKKKVLLVWTLGLVGLYAIGMILQQSYMMHLTRTLQKEQKESDLIDKESAKLFQQIAQLKTKESICAALAPEEFIPLTADKIIQVT